MAETIPGGLYKVGDRFVNANGEPVEAPKGNEEQADEFEGMTKAELVAEAEKRGLEVKRQDGGEGVPTKDDYLAALRA